MTEDLKKLFAADSDGLLTYEYMANNVGACDKDMDSLVDNLRTADRSGQFAASAARFLNAIDQKKYKRHIDALVEHVIDTDREHRYLADLLPDIWGKDYPDKAESLVQSDRNFRRIYQRLYPKGF